jgi:uncharacterized protein with von Willebrand factor type A (vWA) domain
MELIRARRFSAGRRDDEAVLACDDDRAAARRNAWSHGGEVVELWRRDRRRQLNEVALNAIEGVIGIHTCCVIRKSTALIRQ